MYIFWISIPAEIGDCAFEVVVARLACLYVLSAFALEGPLINDFAVKLWVAVLMALAVRVSFLSLAGESVDVTKH